MGQDSSFFLAKPGITFDSSWIQQSLVFKRNEWLDMKIEQGETAGVVSPSTRLPEDLYDNLSTISLDHSYSSSPGGLYRVTLAPSVGTSSDASLNWATFKDTHHTTWSSGSLTSRSPAISNYSSSPWSHKPSSSPLYERYALFEMQAQYVAHSLTCNAVEPHCKKRALELN